MSSHFFHSYSRRVDFRRRNGRIRGGLKVFYEKSIQTRMTILCHNKKILKNMLKYATIFSDRGVYRIYYYEDYKTIIAV